MITLPSDPWIKHWCVFISAMTIPYPGISIRPFYHPHLLLVHLVCFPSSFAAVSFISDPNWGNVVLLARPFLLLSTDRYIAKLSFSTVKTWRWGILLEGGQADISGQTLAWHIPGNLFSDRWGTTVADRKCMVCKLGREWGTYGY